MKNEYIVMIQRPFPLFWTGVGWSSEYPDAFTTTSWDEISKEADKAQTKRAREGKDLSWMYIIENYGYDNERDIICVPSVDLLILAEEARNKLEK